MINFVPQFSTKFRSKLDLLKNGLPIDAVCCEWNARIDAGGRGQTKLNAIRQFLPNTTKGGWTASGIATNTEQRFFLM